MNFWTTLWPTLLAIGIVLAVVPVVGLYGTFVERKLAAAIQDRLGPNRVGPWGIFQAIADGIKIFLKEQVVPSHVHKFLYFLAPCISLMTAMFAICVLPYGPVPKDYQGGVRFIVMPGLDIGLLMMFAISSLSAYGSSSEDGLRITNTRFTALSDRVPSSSAMKSRLVFRRGNCRSGRFDEHRNDRRCSSDGRWISGWNIWWQPLALIIFFTSALAETNRLPFDLPECEQELVGGFHTEYGGIKFVLFFLAEYTHVVTASFLTILLFFGGWHFPGVTDPSQPVDGSVGLIALYALVLITKVCLVVAFIMVLRWALPRFRFDQLMGLAWKGLIPLGMLNLVAVLVMITFDLKPWTLAIVSLILLIGSGMWSVAQLQSRIRKTSTAIA